MLSSLSGSRGASIPPYSGWTALQAFCIDRPDSTLLCLRSCQYRRGIRPRDDSPVYSLLADCLGIRGRAAVSPRCYETTPTRRHQGIGEHNCSHYESNCDLGWFAKKAGQEQDLSCPDSASTGSDQAAESRRSFVTKKTAAPANKAARMLQPGLPWSSGTRFDAAT